jgi:putative endonuclease
MSFWVYILANRRNGAIYTGSTDDLNRRVWQHREGAGSWFTRKYGVVRLVWLEEHGERASALERERRIKHWRRTWKLALIEKENPQWRDLWEEIGI